MDDLRWSWCWWFLHKLWWIMMIIYIYMIIIYDDCDFQSDCIWLFWVMMTKNTCQYFCMFLLVLWRTTIRCSNDIRLRSLQVTGIIRRVWDKWALVDIGCDRLARVHAREHPRERNECLGQSAQGTDSLVHRFVHRWWKLSNVPNLWYSAVIFLR